MERASLVAERCTTCGNLLPCVLHDREMKRVILSGEKEEEPSYEKVGLVLGADGNACRVFATCGERSFIGFGENALGPSRPRLFTLGEAGNTIFNFTELRDRRGESITFLDKVSSFIPFRNGYLAVCDDAPKPTWLLKQEGCSGETKYFWYLTRCPDMQDAWEVERIEMRGEYQKNEKDYKMDLIAELPDGSCLIRGITAASHELMIAQSTADGWRLENVRNAADNKHVSFKTHDKASVLSNVIPFFDGSFIACEMLDELVHLKPSKDDPIKWKVENVWFPSAQFVPGLITGLINNIQHAVLSSDEILLGDQRNGLVMLHHFGADSVFYDGRAFLKDADEQLAHISSVARISDDCFLFGGSSAFSSRQMEGVLKLVTRDKSGAWSERLLFNQGEPPIHRIIVLQTNPPSFLCLNIDGSVTYWALPLDKIKAFHERKAKQNSIPPLPSDL